MKCTDFARGKSKKKEEDTREKSETFILDGCLLTGKKLEVNLS